MTGDQQPSWRSRSPSTLTSLVFPAVGAVRAGYGPPVVCTLPDLPKQWAVAPFSPRPLNRRDRSGSFNLSEVQERAENSQLANSIVHPKSPGGRELPDFSVWSKVHQLLRSFPQASLAGRTGLCHQHKHVEQIQDETHAERDAVRQLHPPAAAIACLLARGAQLSRAEQLEIVEDFPNDARVLTELAAQQNDDQPKYPADDRAEAERPEHHADAV